LSLKLGIFYPLLLTWKKKGIFSGITVSQLQFTDDCLYNPAVSAHEEDVLKTEILRLIDFLKAICDRPPGEKTKLDFLGKYIKMSVILVGKPATRLAFDIRPYIQRVTNSLSKGVDNIFVIAVGEDNVSAVKRIARHFEGMGGEVGRLDIFYPKAFNHQPAIMSLLFRVPCH